MALDAQQHQDIPFEQVVELVQPGAQPGAHPAVPGDVRLAERAGGRGWSSPASGLEAWPLGAQAAAKFDLTLALGEADGRIAGSWTYATALFERATVERWLGYLRRVLEQMARRRRAGGGPRSSC